MNSWSSTCIQGSRTDRGTSCTSRDAARTLARRLIVGACLAAGFGPGGTAQASIATFDTLGEGALATSFSTGGITFFDLDDRAGGGPVTFTIERADGTLSGAGFSSPNTLGFGGWVPGPGAAFGQCGSFWFTSGTVQDFAAVDVFEWRSYAGNRISLDAFLGGAMVNSTSIVLPGDGQLNHWYLSVSGVPFDTVRVNGSGPTDRGVFFGVVDNVVILPEPGVALALAVLCVVRRRR